MKICNTTGGRVTLRNDEWDALCDGCGLCCRVVRERENPEAPAVMCPGYDCEAKQCAVYDKRIGKHACIKLEPSLILGLHEAGILPDSCGYVSFMRGTPKLEPKEFPCLPFSVLNRDDQRQWRRSAKHYQADVEGSLSKFRSVSK